ncbi:MAG: imidazole glycerol phosphate synthase subunit HisH [Candidatus Omnitrophota bacterium]|jgi:glutamine amidotransferase
MKRGIIAVIDYGMGNLRSVEKALKVAGGNAKVTSDPVYLKKADKIVLPGVGAFGEAMAELKRRQLDIPIKDALRQGKMFLGLCLGLQLLFEKSEEDPGVRGLSILKGKVKRFRSGMERGGEKLKVPHMGWNTIDKCSGVSAASAKMLKGVPSGSYMYFVHSYYVDPIDKRLSFTTTDYGSKFISSVCKDNICAFQFHPEKSQALGLKVLENFVRS